MGNLVDSVSILMHLQNQIMIFIRKFLNCEWHLNPTSFDVLQILFPQCWLIQHTYELFLDCERKIHITFLAHLQFFSQCLTLKSLDHQIGAMAHTMHIDHEKTLTPSILNEIHSDAIAFGTKSSKNTMASTKMHFKWSKVAHQQPTIYKDNNKGVCCQFSIT